MSQLGKVDALFFYDSFAASFYFNNPISSFDSAVFGAIPLFLSMFISNYTFDRSVDDISYYYWARSCLLSELFLLVSWYDWLLGCIFNWQIIRFLAKVSEIFIKFD